MNNFFKILLTGILFFGVFGGGVFADAMDYLNNPDSTIGDQMNKVGLDFCRSTNGISTSIKYSNDQTLHCYCAHDGGGYSCNQSNDKKTCPENCSQIRVYNEDVSKKKGLDLIQTFLSTILGFVLKFGAMLAVLAIVLGGIQISMQGSEDGETIGKEKIVGGIAALIVLFFAGVILHFINPAYFTW